MPNDMLKFLPKRVTGIGQKNFTHSNFKTMSPNLYPELKLEEQDKDGH